MASTSYELEMHRQLRLGCFKRDCKICGAIYNKFELWVGWIRWRAGISSCRLYRPASGNGLAMIAIICSRTYVQWFMRITGDGKPVLASW
jgi:hypothetical protein